MTSKPCARRGLRLLCWAAAAVLWPAGIARGQDDPAPPPPPYKLEFAEDNPAAPVVSVSVDREVVPATCRSCTSGVLPPPAPVFSGCGPGGCGGPGCVPGRLEECACHGETLVGRFFAGLYNCICCPDPCYVPQWLPVADAAFFTDAARPRTQTRIRWESGSGFQNLDRAEYFWARLRPAGGKGPDCIPSELDYDDLSFHAEAATGSFGFFIDTPYRHYDPQTAPISDTICVSESGFTDLTIGTKSLLLDCQLVQLAFQFKTFLPSGNFTTGFGTGHVSLEPSLLFNLRVSHRTYLQGQLAYWIPIGGDDLYQGNVFHMHYSLNHLLWKCDANVQLVGTLEFNEWTVFNGRYTVTGFRDNSDPNNPNQIFGVHADTSMFSRGPGLRLFICDKIDIGVGSALAVTGSHWAETVFRTEFRWRF